MRFGVVGINHKLADLKLREYLAKACHRTFSPGHSLAIEYGSVLLSTCNRTEIYFSSNDLTETHSGILNALRNEIGEEFDQKLYSFFGQDCFFHLSKVTAGLDSAILGETEIQGQVKSAYESATKYMVLPSPIHFLFQKALNIGKQVRAKLNMPRGMPDIEDAVDQIGSHVFQGNRECKILFVGASNINLKILSHLKRLKYSDITLINRTRKESLEKDRGVKLLPWEALKGWTQFDWIILGTKAPHHLIYSEHGLNLQSKKLIMDLSVPRNADPKLRDIPEICLMNIDEINQTLKIHKEKMHSIVSQAEALISDAAARFQKNSVVKLQLAV